MCLFSYFVRLKVRDWQWCHVKILKATEMKQRVICYSLLHNYTESRHERNKCRNHETPIGLLVLHSKQTNVKNSLRKITAFINLTCFWRRRRVHFQRRQSNDRPNRHYLPSTHRQTTCQTARDAHILSLVLHKKNNSPSCLQLHIMCSTLEILKSYPWELPGLRLNFICNSQFIRID